MESELRPAVASDVDTLVELMGEYYGEVDSPFDTAVAKGAFTELLAHPELGMVWIVDYHNVASGYIVLTVGFSLEYGGRDAFVDDLYIKEQYRGVGLGRRALQTLLAECRMRDVRAVHLEVEPDNSRARRLYHRFGFRATGRNLLTLPLHTTNQSG